MLQALPLLFVGHAHTMGLQITTLGIVLFILTLYLHPTMSQDLPLQALPMGSSPSPEDTPLSDQQPIMPLIAQSIAAQTAHSHTEVNSEVPTTALSTAPTEAVLINKPKPWTPIQLLILKRELSDYPDKAFVEQLIYDLCHGCTISYNGPQFS